MECNRDALYQGNQASICKRPPPHLLPAQPDCFDARRFSRGRRSCESAAPESAVEGPHDVAGGKRVVWKMEEVAEDLAATAVQRYRPIGGLLQPSSAVGAQIVDAVPGQGIEEQYASHRGTS